MNRVIWLLLLIAWPLSGCAGPARPAEPVGADTAAGRKLYVAKCAKCHKFYDPAKYSNADWQMWMAKMSKKAKLTAEQEQMLTWYIDNTYRTQPTTSPAPAPKP